MMYHEFAQFYDQLMDGFSYEDAYSFINKYALNKGKNFKNILELACGTGNFTRELIADDRKIKAVDLSDDMLAIAENKLRNTGVEFFKMDMKDFIFDEKFDLIISTCDSFNYILSKDDLKIVLKNVYKHLEDDGLFIFDLNSQYKFEGFEKIYIDEFDDVFYTWENFYDKKDRINMYSLNFFVRKGDLYDRFYEEHYERAYPHEEVIEMLKEIGFNNIDSYNDYENNKELETANRIVYIVSK